MQLNAAHTTQATNKQTMPYPHSEMSLLALLGAHYRAAWTFFCFSHSRISQCHKSPAASPMQLRTSPTAHVTYMKKNKMQQISYDRVFPRPQTSLLSYEDSKRPNQSILEIYLSPSNQNRMS